MIEIWSDIPEYGGSYQVSSVGRVRSLTRQITQKSRGGNAYTKTVRGRILKPAKFTKFGHMSMPLGRKSHGRCVHELVMLAFVGPRPKGMDVMHLNGNASDNRLENLKYGSRSENNLMMVFHGVHQFSVEDIRYIRKNRKAISGVDLAKKFDTHTSIISKIQLRQSYSQVTD